MAKHTKPSKEELEAGMKQALDDLENNDDQEEDQDDQEQEDQELEDQEDDANAEDEDEEEQEDSEDSEDEEESDEDEDGEDEKGKKQNWEKRYKDSSREAKRLTYENKEISEAIDEANSLKPPTDEEMKVEFPEWDEMSATERRLAADNFINKKRFELVHGATEKFRLAGEWDKKVDDFIDDPQTLVDHPELEGNVDDFKLFASKKTRRNIDLDDLVLAFVGSGSLKKVSKQNMKKKQMFPKGSGGEKKDNKLKDDRLSADEGRVLMKNDYKKWKELLLAGKIRNE